jgi:starch synthase
MTTPLKILMVAAENDALPGGKVGGIGDVVRDVPPALAERGCSVTVVTPAYGVFAALPGARRLAVLDVGFGGTSQHLELYDVAGRQPHEGVRHWVLNHPLFSACGKGKIYCDEPPQRPFATDASKFALFCAAVAEGIVQNVFGALEVVHLHDWHAACLLILRRYHPAFPALAAIRCVYTIHNLALQGIRPFAGDVSSLDAWYPGLSYERAALADPRWPDCVNPMAVGIRLAAAVHTVSPAYAEEILRPSAVATQGYYGGEGLEADLQQARAEGRLLGILNGCDYPAEPVAAAADWPDLLTLMRSQVLRWAGAEPQLASAHFLAHVRLGALSRQRPAVLLTSIGRITEQKLRLLREPTAAGRPALEALLETLGSRGLFLLLGSGDADYEQFLTATAARYSNFIFLRGYSEALAQALYASGDLLLMPSSFEPCGISQMLALRAGQPCLVHHVGGLKDTVQDGVTGFAFGGIGLTEQATHLVAAVQRALALHQEQPERWQAMRQAAAAVRFRWTDSITAYLEQLYQHDPA